MRSKRFIVALVQINWTRVLFVWCLSLLRPIKCYRTFIICKYPRYEQDLDALLPDSRKQLLDDLSNYVQFWSDTEKAGKFQKGQKPPKPKMDGWVKLLQEHEQVRLKAEQQLVHTKSRLESTKALLAQGGQNSSSQLKAFHEIGFQDKMQSMVWDIIYALLNYNLYANRIIILKEFS